MLARTKDLLQIVACAVAIVLPLYEMHLIPLPDAIVPAPLRLPEKWYLGKRIVDRRKEREAERGARPHQEYRQFGPGGTRLLNHEGGW